MSERIKLLEEIKMELKIALADMIKSNEWLFIDSTKRDMILGFNKALFEFLDAKIKQEGKK